VKADDSGSNGLDAIPEQDISNTLKCSTSTNFRSGSMKLGDVVTVKVYQIRAYGLVLELSDGVRGMHKFVVIS
jgi:polyribonucleotide nucleotidyltransferase